MSERLNEELVLLREAWPDLEHQNAAGADWVRIPAYPCQASIWGRAEVEVAFVVPAEPGQAPYAFRVRPGLELPEGQAIANYAYPVDTPWGADWGQFSWSPTGPWVPTVDIRLGPNMLTFARSFSIRLSEAP
jgi:hypothetical protein